MPQDHSRPGPELIARHSAAWVERFIVKYNICPFARAELEKQAIRYAVIEESAPEQALLALVDECRRLDEMPAIATTLAIFPGLLDDFDDYLDFLAIAEQLLIQQGYEGIYQLASFHPNYCFDGSDEDDAANYTNRAPYPTLHIIREDAMALALSTYLKPEKIPERNIEFTRRMGNEKLQAVLASCMAAG